MTKRLRNWIFALIAVMVVVYGTICLAQSVQLSTPLHYIQYSLTTPLQKMAPAIGQTGNIIEWYNQSLILESYIDPNGNIFTNGPLHVASYATTANCASAVSPAVCGGAPAGSVAILASTTSIVVNTTAVTANSEILVTEDRSLGATLTVTCDTTSSLTIGNPVVTARVAGTSFTIGLQVAPATNPACLSYLIVN